ncbi:MAG: hypothetical protein AB8G22_07550 [Saprospiraceae bacterium]
MKAKMLNQVVFKKFLPVVYEDLEPHLLAELERLRNELIELPEDTTKEIILESFKNAVYRFNDIDNDENIESTIDTEEREGLCEVLSHMGAVLGLDEDGEYLDEWREW